jgi:hypothetical protein
MGEGNMTLLTANNWRHHQLQAALRRRCRCECHEPGGSGPDKWWGEWCCHC